ncbi:hypothetical protein ACH5RR_009161, partial [Cinchona calisaya]
ESVSSSEDIFAKTKSVIELKKLQLLELQRRLRSDILNDFFKPIAPEMDRLKSIKKHRIGRRSKQLERYEQKMKEERQKRIRERQKEFFTEVEVHRERLEDAFKMKRERWKVFNKYVREFHKRKERIHREKIDRIQREKINLLKINDVEGYLRMVQDAKSDRVKQLLKETEKYLQKLGSKLQEAKTVARRFETDTEENRTITIVDKNEIAIENEDETDQAKHYLESNEKYYMMAHSVKENVLEQPTILVGGKLREYQMNGLRWLVSLYNNHLNGILADEMGLGKTVQVISLMCYLMETKNDRGPFLVVVPSSVLPGWESEINFWAPGIHKIVYSGPPEERRKLFKEQIVHQKFNVLLTTYEYLMNKHDRPKLCKVQWHYIIIDEGHRIKNASCKLNADLKHYRSNHRLLLTGTPLQNNLEELWALLNFLLPNIFNSSVDFSQWFNKPFESNGDNSPDEALLSEEENLLIINRLHQVLRPFVLRRLKHKVENQLPDKIERLVRCEASAYQKLLTKRVEDNLGAIGMSKARSVQNSVMELRNICNHPYLSQLHVEEVHDWIPKHYLPNIVRLCGKLEMLDRLLPKLKATDHRVLLFSTMTRLLDVMEDYLCWKQYKYLRLDGHTCGGDRGALIEQFNQPSSPFFIFLLSIRAGGVGVNLQAADTVIIFDTDWNPQVDLQAQARAHRIGQKRDVLVLRLETVQTVEEQVRASAEHKLGVANQSITAGFFDNNTSAEDRREYLESLLRECKKEEAAPVLDDDALNDLIARSESEIDIFESVDKKRREEEMGTWRKLVTENGTGDSGSLPPLPSRLLMDDDLKQFYEAMKISEAPQGVASNSGIRRKRDYLGGLDTRQYGRGKRAREVRSYEEQWTEEEFEKLCQVESPDSPQVKEETIEKKLSTVMSESIALSGEAQAQMIQQPVNPIAQLPVNPIAQLPVNPTIEPIAVVHKEVTPPSKRGRGRPRRTPIATESSPSSGVLPSSSGSEQFIAVSKVENVCCSQVIPITESLHSSNPGKSITGAGQQIGMGIDPGTQSVSLTSMSPAFQHTTLPCPSTPVQGRGRGRKTQSGGEGPRRRGKRQSILVVAAPPTPTGISMPELETQLEAVSSSSINCNPDPVLQPSNVVNGIEKQNPVSNVPLLSSSASGKLVLGSQEVAVSSSIMPASDAFPDSLALAGVSNSTTTPIPDAFPSSVVMAAVIQQDMPVETAPCPNPVQIDSFPSVISGSQSATLAHPAPMRGRGRGRKAQSGGEAPRRRGKRLNPEASVTSEVPSHQDPSSVEHPEKKSRVSVGRRPTMGNKQDRDGLKQANVLESVASQSIADPAVGQVFDSRPENEAKKPTNLAFKNSVDSLVGPVDVNNLGSEAQKTTNTFQAGASQSIAEPSMIQVSNYYEENEASNKTNSLQSNASQNIACLPLGQVCDVKSRNEAQRRMKSVEFSAIKVLADPPTLQESKAERQDDGQKAEVVVQFDPSLVTADSSVTNIDENQQCNGAQKQMNIVLSDPSHSKGDAIPSQANQMEQESEAHEPASDVESDASVCNADPSRGQRQESETEGQPNTGQNDAPQIVIDPPVVQVNKSVLENDAQTHLVGSCLPKKIEDPLDSGVQDVNQETEAHKETDIQSNTTAIVSGSDQIIEGTDDKCESESIKGGKQEIEEVRGSFVDQHPTLSTSEMPVSDVLLGRYDDQGRRGEQGKKYSCSESGCVSILPTEENASQAIHVAFDKSDDLSTEQDAKTEEREEAGCDDFLASKPEVNANILLQEHSQSTLAIVEPAMMVCSSSVSDPENQSEDHAKRNFLVNETHFSDPRLTDDRNVSEDAAVDPLFPISSNFDNVALKDQICDGKTCVGLSTFASMATSRETEMSENLSEKHGAGEVELTYSVFDGSQTSYLLSEATAAPDSEVFEERSDVHCDKRDATEHEKEDIVLRQDSISVLSTMEHVGSVSDHTPDKSEDLCQNGDRNDPNCNATGLDEIFVLKHELTVTDSLQETSSPTLIASKEEAPQLDTTVNETRNQAREEDANEQENKNSSVVESLVPKPEVSEVNIHSGKIDAQQLESRGCFEENTLVLTRGLAHRQVETKSLTCSTQVTDAVVVYLPNEACENQAYDQFQVGEVGHTSNVNVAFVPTPDNCEIVNKSHLVVPGVVTEVREDVKEEKSSPLQSFDVQMACNDGATEEKSHFQSSEDFATEMLENRNVGVVTDLGCGFGSFKVLEERIISDAEICGTRPSAIDGKSENGADLEIVEENSMKDGEVAESSVLAINLKDDMAKVVAQVDSDSQRDDSEQLENRGHILEKGFVSTVDVTGAQSLEELTSSTILVLETEKGISTNGSQSENEADLQHVEDNLRMDVSREVTVSTVQTVNLKDGLAEMAVDDSDSRRDYSEKLESRDHILEMDSVSTAEVTGTRCLGKMSSTDLVLETENKKVEVVPNAAVASESFNVDERVVSNANIRETKPSDEDGKSDNEADSLAEENPIMDMDREVAVPNFQTINLKEDLLEMPNVESDSGRDDSVELQTRDDSLVKDSVSEVEVTGSPNLKEKTSSTVSELETDDLVVQLPKFSQNLEERTSSAVSDFGTEDSVIQLPTKEDNLCVKETEVVEDGNASNSNVSSVAAAEFRETETECGANSLETMINTRKCIDEKASSSLETANPDDSTTKLSEPHQQKSETGSFEGFVAEVQGCKNVELDKIVVADAEVSESQPHESAGTSEDKDGLQQLVEEYSEMATDL